MKGYVCLLKKKCQDHEKEKSKLSWASADILNEVFPSLGLEVWLRTLMRVKSLGTV